MHLTGEEADGGGGGFLGPAESTPEAFLVTGGVVLVGDTGSLEAMDSVGRRSETGKVDS